MRIFRGVNILSFILIYFFFLGIINLSNSHFLCPHKKFYNIFYYFVTPLFQIIKTNTNLPNMLDRIESADNYVSYASQPLNTTNQSRTPLSPGPLDLQEPELSLPCEKDPSGNRISVNTVSSYFGE